MKKYVIKCMNEQCDNYNQEVDESIEVCKLCGEKIKKVEIKTNVKLKIISIFAAIIGLMLFVGAWGTPWYASFAVVPASVILGFISKSKSAIITTNFSLMIFIGIFILNFYIL